MSILEGTVVSDGHYTKCGMKLDQSHSIRVKIDVDDLFLKNPSIKSRQDAQILMQIKQF